MAHDLDGHADRLAALAAVVSAAAARLRRMVAAGPHDVAALAAPPPAADLVLAARTAVARGSHDSPEEGVCPSSAAATP